MSQSEYLAATRHWQNQLLDRLPQHLVSVVEQAVDNQHASLPVGCIAPRFFEGCVALLLCSKHLGVTRGRLSLVNAITRVAVNLTGYRFVRVFLTLFQGFLGSVCFVQLKRGYQLVVLRRWRDHPGCLLLLISVFLQNAPILRG